MKEIQARSSYWDNVKVLLIFLVVLGHYFGYGFVYGDLSQGRWLLPNAIYGFVYMFHMPLFAFVSGFFSKNADKCQRKAVPQYLIPYVVFNIICVLMNYFLLGVPITSLILEPYNHMWYLFALFVWRLTAKYAVKIKYNWVVALVIAVLCALFTPIMDNNLVSRTILFWPFFLLGLGMNEEQVMQVKKLPRWLCGAVLVGMLILSVLILRKFQCSTYRLCFLARSYTLDKQGLIGVCKLLLRYVTAFVLGICVLNLVPDKGLRITGLGKNTMSIYLLHSLPKLRNTMNALNPKMGNLWFCLFWYTLWTVGAMAVFGNKYVSRIIDGFLRWIERIYGKLTSKLIK